MSTDRVGDVLVRRGVVDQALLDAAVAQGRRTGMRLLSQLWLLGQAHERDLVQALADVRGTPTVVLGESAIPLALLELIPADAARERRILPIAESDGALLVAAADSLDDTLLDELRFVTGRTVVLFAALQVVLERLIAAAYAVRGTTGLTHFFGTDADPRQPPSLAIVRPAGSSDARLPDSPLLSSEDLELFPEPAVPVLRPVALVVDDEPSIRLFVSEALGELDLEVIALPDGAQAAEWLKTGTPSLVVSDVMLPGVHGFELARMVKSGARFGGVPVVLMSAAYRGWRVQEDVRDRLGVDAYFEKPFRLELFLAKVAELLGRDPGTSLLQRRQSALDAFAAGAKSFQAGDLAAAEEQLRTAVEADPMHVRAHFLLALLYSKQQRTFLGIDHLERIAALEPRNFKTLQTLASLYESSGFRHQAAGALERALVAAPEDVRDGIRQRLAALLFS